MASLTFSPTTLHIVLASLNLLQYEDALIKAGYDYLNCFDTENNTIEELSQELTNDVPMKKPHARKLTRYLFSQQHQHLMSAPAAQDVDDGALAIADAIPMPRVLNNTTPSVDPAVPSVDPTVDPQLIGKEIQKEAAVAKAHAGKEKPSTGETKESGFVEVIKVIEKILMPDDEELKWRINNPGKMMELLKRRYAEDTE